MTSIQNAVAKVDRSVVNLIPQYDREFAAVLPEHIKSSAFVSLAVAALKRDPKLMEAAESNPGSLIYALRECARLGHEPGTSQFYLTPRKEKGVPKILGIEGYQGVIERIYRAGAVSSVVVEVVRKNDSFRYVIGKMDRPEHEIDWTLDDDERGELYLAYAYGIMHDGNVSKVATVNKSRIARAKAESPGSDYESSPWKKHVESMWLKTAAHDLEKWVPTSSEYRREQLRAVREVAAETPMPLPMPAADPITGEVVEGVIDNGDWPAATLPGDAA